MDIIEMFDKEMKEVTTMLSFLIVQPQFLTSMSGVEKEKVMSVNLLRTKCCKLWAENMVKEVETKCSKEGVKAMNQLFENIKVNKK